MENFLLTKSQFHKSFILEKLLLIDGTETFWHSPDNIIDLPTKDEDTGSLGPTGTIVKYLFLYHINVFMLYFCSQVLFQRFQFPTSCVSVPVSLQPRTM